MKRLALVLFSILFISACAGMSTRTSDLLAEDYRTMTMPELQFYYHQLSDQLGRETYAEQHASAYLWHSGNKAALADLRARWNEVREALRRRQ